MGTGVPVASAILAALIRSDLARDATFFSAAVKGFSAVGSGVVAFLVTLAGTLVTLAGALADTAFLLPLAR